MLITANNGSSHLKLTAKSITLLDGLDTESNCHSNRMMLSEVKRGLKTGFGKGFVVPIDPTCMYRKMSCKPKQYTISGRDRWIGCCYFDEATWKIIMKAVRKATAKKGKANARTN